MLYIASLRLGMTLFFSWLLPAPTVSEVVGNGCKMILTTFYYTLVL